MTVGGVRVAVIGGEGVVIRRGDVVVVLGAPATEAVVAEAERALAGATGPARVRAVARLLLDDHASAGGAVVALDDVAEVFALGSFEVVARSGRHAAAHHVLGLSEQIPLDELVAVVPSGTDVPDLPAWSDLTAGAATGTGVVVTVDDGGSIAADRAEATAPTDVPATGRFELISLTESVDLSDRMPLPVDGPRSGKETVASDTELYRRPVTVRGVMSAQGYFNHPDATHCSRTGVAMGPPEARELVEGVRPPLGVFTFDDLSTCSVQWNMVMGRDPRGDERVVSGEAAPYPLSDARLKVSRRHLLVELVDWDVFIDDLGSSNGTFVRASDGALLRLTPGERHRIQTGSEILLGDRSFTYDEHHVR